MARKPRSKKSEALEIRVSHEEKQAFMDAVSTRGTTASTVLREAMDLFVRNGRIRRRNVMITTTLVIISAGVLTLQTIPEGETQVYTGLPEFTAMDRDGDRRVSLEEFQSYRDTAYAALSGANGAGAFGTAAGILLASFGDAAPSGFGRMVRETPEQISDACWAALEESWQTRAVADHQRLDTNSDGLISVSEFSNRQANRRREIFNWLDVDDNGLLGMDEMLPADDGGSGESRPARARALPAHISICFGDVEIPERQPVPEADRLRYAESMMTFFDLDEDGWVSWEEYRTSMDVN